MGKWGCWLAVAVHVVVRGKEVMFKGLGGASLGGALCDLPIDSD